MRITVNLNDELHVQAMADAKAQGITLSAYVENALRNYLAGTAPRPRRHIALPTHEGSGLMPGVDINDSAALLDVMDEGLPPEKMH